MGSSLGGYTSAWMASIDDRLDFVIPILPPASMAHVLWDEHELGPEVLHYGNRSWFLRPEERTSSETTSVFGAESRPSLCSRNLM